MSLGMFLVINLLIKYNTGLLATRGLCDYEDYCSVSEAHACSGTPITVHPGKQLTFALVAPMLTHS